MADELWSPEWCIVGTLLPYPYSPTGPQAKCRSQKIFPAGAKLHILGGFSGMDTRLSPFVTMAITAATLSGPTSPRSTSAIRFAVNDSEPASPRVSDDLFPGRTFKSPAP